MFLFVWALLSFYVCFVRYLPFLPTASSWLSIIIASKQFVLPQPDQVCRFFHNRRGQDGKFPSNRQDWESSERRDFYRCLWWAAWTYVFIYFEMLFMLFSRFFSFVFFSLLLLLLTPSRHISSSEEESFKSGAKGDSAADSKSIVFRHLNKVGIAARIVVRAGGETDVKVCISPLISSFSVSLLLPLGLSFPLFPSLYNLPFIRIASHTHRVTISSAPHWSSRPSNPSWLNTRSSLYCFGLTLDPPTSKHTGK